MVEINDLLCSPPHKNVLTELDIHIWCVSLHRSSPTREQLKSLLSADEQAKVGRFYVEEARQRYICARGILRILLGYYLDSEPQKVELSYGSYGKPYIIGSPQEMALSFNLSHSNGFALYAFSLGRRLGIDLEYIREVARRELLVRKFFSQAEQAAFDRLPRHEQQESFFRTWTRKEAYLKATGSGLKKLLREVEVPVSAKRQTALLSIIDGSHRNSELSLHDIFAPPGYVAALVTEGSDLQLVYPVHVCLYMPPS